MMTAKTPVLVVLPPSHKCADLGKVLGLARKAFGNLALSIADLNVQFESVSSGELLLGADTSDGHADNSSFNATTTSQREPPQETDRNHVDPWAPQDQSSAPDQDQGHVPDAETAAQSAPAPAGTSSQQVFHPTPQPSPARSASVTSTRSRGSDFGATTATPESAPSTRQPAQPAQPAAAFVPSGPLPDAHPSHWCLIVGNLDGALSTDDILATIVPGGISLTGATFHSPVPAGPGKSGPLVRYVKLAFASEQDAHACHAWVKQEADKGGIVYGMVAPGCNVHVGNPIRPVPSATPPPNGPVVVQAPVAEAASINTNRGGALNPHAPVYRPSATPTPTPTPRPSSSASAHTPGPSTAAAAASPLREANPKAAFRLTIGNLLPDLTPHQLLSGVLPRGISPVGLTLVPVQQLLGRDDSVRRVVFEFATKHDLEHVFEYVKAQEGQVAEMVAPRTKLVVSMTGVAPPVKVKAPALRESTPTPTPTPSLPATAKGVPAAVAAGSDFPEASPSAYRLHISNLLPTVDAPQIVAALVPPKGVTVLGVSMFTPRPLSGSKRDVLVRSLKLAFATEMEAKKCVDWIKKDVGGGVARLVVKGAKVSVGNPMAPME